MPKKTRKSFTRREGHSKKIGNAITKAKKQFEQESSNSRNQGTGSPGIICGEIKNENDTRLIMVQDVKRPVLNKCDSIQSEVSCQSPVCDSIKSEQNDYLSVENTSMYKPIDIPKESDAEKFADGNGDIRFGENSTLYFMDHDVKPQILDEFSSIQSDVSNLSPVYNSVKSEPNDDISVENTVLYQPTCIVGTSSLDEQFIDKKGDIWSAEDSTRSGRSSYLVKKEESTISFNDVERYDFTLCTSEEGPGTFKYKSLGIKNEQVLDESGPQMIIIPRLKIEAVGRERRDQCQSCKYVASSESILEMHTESMDLDSNNLKCHLCDFTCDLREQLKIHISEMHLKLHKFQCSLRDSSLDAKKGYRTVLSDGKLKFWCNDCDYNSILKNHVDIHISLQHPPLKTFKCMYCDFNSTHYWNWKTHMDCVHLKLKNFQCDICDCSYGLKQTLQRHIDAVHLKKKEHQCNYCDFSASQRGTLQKHIKFVHEKTK